MSNSGTRAQFIGHERKHWSVTNHVLEEFKEAETLVFKKEHVYGNVPWNISEGNPKIEITNNIKSVSLFYH